MTEMKKEDVFWGEWLKACLSEDYSAIDKMPLKDILEIKKMLGHGHFVGNREHQKAFNRYIVERQESEKTEQEENERRREQRRHERKMLIITICGVIAIPVIFSTLEIFYFGEVRNRPYLSVSHNPMRNMGTHIEYDDTGKEYEDKSRSDVQVVTYIKNSTNTPANIVRTERYITYKGEELMPLAEEREYQLIYVSPIDPVKVVLTFMILDNHINDFEIITKIYYFGRKFFGWKYLGRQYIHYARVKWNGRTFNIEETTDIR